MEPIQTVFLGGTGVVPLLAPMLYRNMAGGIKPELLKSLPVMGLRPCEWTFLQVANWFDSKVKPRQKVIIIGYSQGGLHGVRLGIERRNVVRVITIAAPHHGTDLAQPAIVLGPIAAGLSDMRPQSPYMRRYVDCLPKIAPRLYSIYSRHDGLVHPYHSAHVEGANNFLFATPNEYRVIGRHASDTAWLAGKPNHFGAFFDEAITKALLLVNEITEPLSA